MLTGSKPDYLPSLEEGQKFFDIMKRIRILELNISKRKLIRAHGGCLWLSEAKKDVISCEKRRGGANNL